MIWKLALALSVVLFATAAEASDARTLTLDGRARAYLVYRPAGLERTKPVPLVVVLHGALGSGKQAERAYHWDREADEHGFVVVYPDGIRRTWNAGGTCCGPAHRDGIDDVAFITRLIETVVADEAIDAKRVYLAGMSSGGAMTYRYACEGTFPLAAIGAVATSFTFSCPKPHALSLMAFHGLDDRTVPYAGGASRRGKNLIWQPVEETVNVFRRVDGCESPVLAQQGVVRTMSSHCAAGREVIFTTIVGAGHQWPGSERESGLFASLLRLDPPSDALDATAQLWSFFAHHAAD